MAAGGSTQQSLRRAIGALKDSTKVGLAKVNSGYKALDIAIVKATNHDEVLAKEKHIRTIFSALSSSTPRADVAYCIQALAKRLAKTQNWAVALKTLIVMHRAMREIDSTFREEFINYSQNRALMLNLSHFKDDSGPNAWNYSAWVRTYALYLEEHLECFRLLKYDIQTYHSPEGAAVYNKLIQYALSILAGECVKLYGAITNGILNLVDKYFEMQKHDAVRALEIYQKAGNQAEKLSEFFEICRGLDFGRVQFVKIEQPPATFMTAMEEYVKDTPCTLACQPITYPTNDVKVNLKKNAIREDNRVSDQKQDFDVEEILDPSLTSPEPPRSDQIEAAAKLQVTELLDLDELIQEASELDEKNALGVAIFTSENPSNSANGLNLSCQTTGWELALVTAPSSSGAAVAESKLAGGMDKLTLDSLYDDAIAGRASQNRTYHMGQLGSNPFELANSTRDPFYASSNIAPLTNVEMAGITQQEEGLMMQQQQYRQPLIGEDPTNPFGNPFVEPGIPSHFK
ncbi:putative clathrin assembly protein At5g35200 isoform X2 [Vitis riparia]|uniref:putative clathrin assembly protein At5g35200 isoform X2 n=1 Tax=Vitis riparia TaxID=96939 RepID=UPI00155A6BE0|nr:putative clathrin assembly protein At5g35200 isoform X2 [Vitis riparia]